MGGEKQEQDLGVEEQRVEFVMLDDTVKVEGENQTEVVEEQEQKLVQQPTLKILVLAESLVRNHIRIPPEKEGLRYILYFFYLSEVSVTLSIFKKTDAFFCSILRLSLRTPPSNNLISKNKKTVTPLILS